MIHLPLQHKPHGCPGLTGGLYQKVVKPVCQFVGQLQANTSMAGHIAPLPHQLSRRIQHLNVVHQKEVAAGAFFQNTHRLRAVGGKLFVPQQGARRWIIAEHQALAEGGRGALIATQHEHAVRIFDNFNQFDRFVGVERLKTAITVLAR